MNSKHFENWSYKWSSTGIGSDYAMFSCPEIRTNILYTFEQIKEILLKNEISSIPYSVLAEAANTHIAMREVAKTKAI